MRKSGITTVAVALVLLCGCTKNESGLEFQLSTFPMSLNMDCSALVDVSASVSGGTRTRAAVYESITDLAEDGIGIYCLPARKNNPTADDIIFNRFIQYDTDGYLINENGVYWDNVKFTIGDQYSADPDTYRLKMADDAVRPLFEYYPLTSSYGYDFYGYAPYQEGSKDNLENLIYNDAILSVKFAMDGTKDIVFGKSVTPDDSATYPTYYSAKYFRDSKRASAVEMAFEHKLVRLNFFVKPLPATIKDLYGNEPPANDYSGVDTLAVKSLNLLEMRDSIRMVIASTKRAAGQGLVPGEIEPANYKGEKITLKLHKRNDMGEWVVPDTLAHIHHSRVDENGRIQLGECMMVTPQSSYIMELQLCSQNNPEILFPKNKIKLSLPLKDGKAQSFKPGYEYNITLSVEGPTAINIISATMTDWKTDEEYGDLDINYFDY